jgi:hypothetical protein
MSEPRYSVGCLVKHVSKNKIGTVETVFHDGNEYRYEVKHSGWLWSVPESALTYKSSSEFEPTKKSKIAHN